MPQLVARVIGADYHDSLRDLSAKMLKSGMQAGAVINLLYAMMDASEGPHDLRWTGRRSDIPRLVRGFEGKPGNDETSASALEFFDDAIAETKSKNWLLKNVAALNETSSWVGPPKSGKSALIVDKCIAIARGEDWRGFTIKRQAGVVYFALERGDLVKRRLKGHAKRDRLQSIPFALRKGVINLMAEDCIDFIVGEINEAAKHFKCDVGIIVIDTFSKGIAAGGGNEDKAADQNRVAANLRVVQERIRTLAQAGILRAVSVGFVPLQATPRAESKRGGVRYRKLLLREVSLVSIPANANALAVKAKALGVSDWAIRKALGQTTNASLSERQAWARAKVDQLLAEKRAERAAAIARARGDDGTDWLSLEGLTEAERAAVLRAKAEAPYAVPQSNNPWDSPPELFFNGKPIYRKKNEFGW